MNITITNKSDGSVRAHKTGCQHVGRETRKHLDETFVIGDFDTKYDVIAEYNSDFDKETDGWYDIDFAPCVTIPDDSAKAVITEIESLLKPVELTEHNQRNTKVSVSCSCGWHATYSFAPTNNGLETEVKVSQRFADHVRTH